MAELPTSYTAFAKMPLGVGNIMADIFGLLRRHFVLLLFLAFLPTALGLFANYMYLGLITSIARSSSAFSPWFAIWTSLGAIAIQLSIFGFVGAMIVQLAYNSKMGNHIRALAYVGPALRATLPIALLSFVVTILACLSIIAAFWLMGSVGGGQLLLVPAAVFSVWVFAVFFPMSTVVVIERDGKGALSRAAWLTKSYRWQIIGIIILLVALSYLLFQVINYLIGVASPRPGVGTLAIVQYTFIAALPSAFFTALSGAAIAQVYARLREIKEGISVQHILDVFD